MPEINILPEVVQNKIAAGEVVERPASAVKELVENAIDAGADAITVEIENGGGDLIRVSDNGCGMNRENLARAVERHATSKIRDIDDIFHISTLGFRGEALPSIASVAKLTITTCQDGDAEGSSLTVEGGKKREAQPAPPRRGTMVEVRNLFFNTPARRKFMKSPAAEVTAVSEVLTRLALAHPEISFRLLNSGRSSLELSAVASQEERITALFGKLPLLPVDYHSPHGLDITGFLAEPPESRAQSRFIYTLLNGRWFRHAGIARAAADACAGSLPPRRYPFAVLNFTIDTSRVDVNAHPAKEVIRFENEALIVGGASHAVRAALEARHFAVAGVYAPPEPPANAPQVTEAVGGYLRSLPVPEKRYGNFGNFPGAGRPGGDFSAPRSGGARPGGDLWGRWGGGSALPAPEMPTAPAGAAAPAPETARAETSGPGASAGQWRLLGQAGGKYLVVETPDGVMLVDQHALHERWNYERLKERPREIISQELLVPEDITLSPAEEAAAEQALPVLRGAGFAAEIVEVEGARALRVTAHPEFVRRRDLEAVCRDVLAGGDEEKTPGEDLRERLLARLACRSAVLFGTTLADELCAELLERLMNNYLPTCPHGRPTSITLSWTELANKFGR